MGINWDYWIPTGILVIVLAWHIGQNRYRIKQLEKKVKELENKKEYE